MGILDSVVEWAATQIMNFLDIITGSVLGALGCDMGTFLRYFPAAETMYRIFVAAAIGFILLELVWQLFLNFGAGAGIRAEDPVKLVLRSAAAIFLAFYADQVTALVLGIAGTPYSWIVDASLPPIDFASFSSVLTVMDAFTNENVMAARERVIRTGAEMGFDMTPFRWDPEHKGIDDLLLSFRERKQTGRFAE